MAEAKQNHATPWDRAVDATEQLHQRKVAALLNSQNRLRCANAALKHEDLTRKEASNGRGAALARAERELLQQDVVLRAFYNFLGKDVARKQIRRALEAGPKRIRPTTREELRWKLEDLREELAQVKEEAKEKVKREEETEAKEEQRGNQEDIKVQRQAIEEWKKRIEKLEQQNSAYQVEISSLERALQSGLERLGGPEVSAARRPPWQLLASQTEPVKIGVLKEQLLEKEKAFNKLQQERHEMQEDLLKAQKVSQQLAEEAKERREELQRLRHGSGEAKRRTSVVHQGEILAMKKEVDAGENALEEVRARRNSMRAEQKGVVLDGKRRISVLEVDLAKQEKQSQKDLEEHLASEEEALAAQQREQLEDVAKSEHQAEAALELCRKEAALYRSAASEHRAAAAGLAEAAAVVSHGAAAEAAAAAAVAAEAAEPGLGLGARAAAEIAEELALAKGLSPQEAQEQGALAAAALGAETLSLSERQANLKRSIALREELVAKTQEIQEEYEEEKTKRDEMVLERIDLELELETETRICEKNFLARKRMVEKPIVTQLMPGVSVSSVDLLCLRSELTVQKELAEQEVSQSRQEVAQAEAILAAVTEAAVEHKEMAAARRRHGGEDSQKARSSLLDEARHERQLAKESLQAALEDLHLNGLRTQDLGLPEEASCVESDVSQDWIRVPIHVSNGKGQLLKEVEEAKEALAVQRSVAAQTGQLAALHAEAEALEVQNLHLQEQKRDLELRLSAAQFALKRWPKRHQVSARGCPFCEHCQVGDSG